MSHWWIFKIQTTFTSKTKCNSGDMWIIKPNEYRITQKDGAWIQCQDCRPWASNMTCRFLQCRIFPSSRSPDNLNNFIIMINADKRTWIALKKYLISRFCCQWTNSADKITWKIITTSLYLSERKGPWSELNIYVLAKPRLSKTTLCPLLAKSSSEKKLCNLV